MIDFFFSIKSIKNLNELSKIDLIVNVYRKLDDNIIE